jgi:hypothetical protein
MPKRPMKSRQRYSRTEELRAMQGVFGGERSFVGGAVGTKQRLREMAAQRPRPFVPASAKRGRR